MLIESIPYQLGGAQGVECIQNLTPSLQNTCQNKRNALRVGLPRPGKVGSLARPEECPVAPVSWSTMIGVALTDPCWSRANHCDGHPDRMLLKMNLEARKKANKNRNSKIIKKGNRKTKIR